MSFPLYDMLHKQCTDDDLTIGQKKTLIENISKMNVDGHKNIFTIIRIHGLKNKNGDVFDIPYDGQKTADSDYNIKFNLDKLPNIVKQMIFKFTIIHTNEVADKN